MSTTATFFLPSDPSSSSGLRPYGLRRYIDPTTRDYVVRQGELVQDDGFTSKVVLALATRLGSAQALPEFGSRLHEIKHADERGRLLAEKHALRALAHLADEIAELRVTASLSTKRRGAIDVTVSGRCGERVLNANYTAVLT